MIPKWAADTVERLRPGTKTARGSEIADWSNPEVVEITGCSMQPAGTELSQDGRVQGITDGYTCYLPPGSDVQEGDRIRYDGKTYTINGSPRIWKSPSGRLNHIQLELERWDG